MKNLVIVQMTSQHLVTYQGFKSTNLSTGKWKVDVKWNNGCILKQRWFVVLKKVNTRMTQGWFMGIY